MLSQVTLPGVACHHFAHAHFLLKPYIQRWFVVSREEDEKFNIWLAYLNLENQFADSPEDAALRLFQRASQYTDPKKLHLAALTMFERSARSAACEQLVRAMCRKFGGSAKVRPCLDLPGAPDLSPQGSVPTVLEAV